MEKPVTLPLASRGSERDLWHGVADRPATIGALVASMAAAEPSQGQESTSTFCSTNHGIAVMPRFYFDIRKGVRFSVDMPQARQVDRPDKQRRRKWDCDHRISVAAGQVRTGRHRKPETSMRIEAGRFLLSGDAGGDDRGGRQPGRAARARRGGRACRLGRMRGLAARLDRGLRLPDVARRLPAGRRLGAGPARSTGRPTSPAWRREVAYNSMDLLQAAAHLVRRRDGAVGSARQGARRAGLAAARLCQALSQKTPYASLLFGDTPQETLERGARRARAKGFRAAKFGWGPIGRGDA